MNCLKIVKAGAVGIVTNGAFRDAAELLQQKTPICARQRGRTIIPGRIEILETQSRIGCGGVQVRPGDLIGCDDDGIVVVPIEIAATVATHARAVLLADMKIREGEYRALGMTADDTVDYETVMRYYDSLASG